MITVKIHKPSGTIVLDRAEGNSLTRSMVAELESRLNDLHQELHVRAIILTGAGENFCSGIDLAELQATSEEENAMQLWYEDVVALRDLILKLLHFPKPIIAAVNGPVSGVGVALLLACDLVVATPNAQLSLPEPKRGLVAGLASPLLAFRAGAGAAAKLLFTGETIEAEEAKRLNLYHEIVPDHLIWAQAHALAEKCAACAPESIQLTKRMLNETIGEQLQTQLTAGASATATARTTAAAREGVAAYFEGRDANWFKSEED